MSNELETLKSIMDEFGLKTVLVGAKDTNSTYTLDRKDAIIGQLALALVEERSRRGVDGLGDALIELSMYVGEDEWDSAQRNIHPSSRRVSLEEAQSMVLGKENGDE